MTEPETEPLTSPDPVPENIAKLGELFPEAVTEDGIDLEVLGQLIGKDAEIADGEETYGLSWSGKRLARQIAITPSTGTLRPAPEDSVDWNTTRNVVIEGDNLEVLKLLKSAYAGKVKLIYIDPPYNTGKDFVYKDDFKDSIGNYLEQTGQIDEEGNRLSTNTETSGRFHTDWLNMMYPRLKLARDLLSEDGVMVCSIGEEELSRLRQCCEGIFGEQCVVGTFPWRRRTGSNDSKQFFVSIDHEYLVIVAKTSHFEFAGTEKDSSNYKNPDNDPRGPWTRSDLTCNKTRGERPNLFYPLTDPETGEVHECNPDRVWAYEKETMENHIRDGKVLFPTAGEKTRPAYKRHLSEVRSTRQPLSSWIERHSSNGNRESKGLTFPYTGSATSALNELMGVQCFNYPKSVVAISQLIEQSCDTSEGHLILDFFAGSGTTGHAVMARNAEDGGNRRYILVQLPEPLDPEVKEQKVAADFCDELGVERNIAELTKERLRRAGEKVKEDNPDFEGDTGFRVFRLDSTNIKAWDPDMEDLEKTLEDSIETLKEGRDEEDVLYEVLLKLGLDLCVPIETKEIGGLEVSSIGAGTLFACMADELDKDSVEELGQGILDWRKELDPAGDVTCLFKDGAFSGDQAKTNLVEILKQGGVKVVRCV